MPMLFNSIYPILLKKYLQSTRRHIYIIKQQILFNNIHNIIKKHLQSYQSTRPHTYSYNATSFLICTKLYGVILNKKDTQPIVRTPSHPRIHADHPSKGINTDGAWPPTSPPTPMKLKNECHQERRKRTIYYLRLLLKFDVIVIES